MATERNMPVVLSIMPDLIEANLLLVLFFTGTALLLFLFILISRLRDGVRQRKSRWMDKKAQQFITSYLFNAEEVSPAQLESFRRKYILNSFYCPIFLENLISLQKNLIGESADRLRTLYKDLGLHPYSKQKLYARSWSVIAKGICELAEMGMTQDAELIRAFINHPNPVLRSQALVALVYLQHKAPFSFLDELEEPLTEWQQLQLARAAQKAHAVHPPSFKQWLQKDQESVVLFSIRMIVQYNQHEALGALLTLLNHPSPMVRKEAVIALRNLESFEASEKLLQLYENETVDVRLEILKTLPLIGGDEHLAFYQQQLQDTDMRVQLIAARALAQSGAPGEALIQAIKNNLQHALQPIAACALDSRI
ncbi:HEAT repeat domain-containing protein [Pontibacter liquoris]|uniref:HEAT repeat domain-containing protein n=1 Tax=Pontibacter liquoris TaxID=2905677 RepID=UPI001FA6FAF6|nr:HEAT repeat domain-containing protein [Pontibacter liquoris]